MGPGICGAWCSSRWRGRYPVSCCALPAIREAFGRLVFFPDGTLNREVLSALVFSNEEERKTLNAITLQWKHPFC